MESPCRIESLTFETEALDHVVADRDFERYTRGVASTIHGMVHLRIEMADLGGQPIGNSPYEIDRDVLYSAIAALTQRVIEFCEGRGIEAFEWAPRLEPPVAGREQYATVSELIRWHAEIRDLGSNRQH